MKKKTAIHVENLVYAWPGSSKAALNGPGFDIGEGERIALLGANGSGKSTLLCCLNGLVTADNKASVVVYDADQSPLYPAEKRDQDRVRRRLGSVLQNPDDQIAGSVVEEDIAFGLENLGLDRADIQRKVDETLRLCGLEHLRDRPPQVLSGGEKQRLALAGVLAMDSGIIVLDEAVSMLDGTGREHFLSLLDRLSAEGKTIIQVTHALEEAFRCERCLVLDRGTLVFDGEARDLIERPELEQWGFALPEAVQAIRLLAKTFPGFAASSLDPEEAAREIIRLKIQGTLPQKKHVQSALSGQSIEEAVPDAHPETNGKPAVRFDSVFHEYRTESGFAGIRGVSFDLPALNDDGTGTTLALIGTSGSGKSTALKHINALLLPSRGRVVVSGKDTASKTVRLAELRVLAALSVQNPESALFEEFTADDVAFGPSNAGLAGNALKEKVRAAMDEAGLPFENFADRKTRSLSGGEKRQAAIAGAAAMDSPILVLDEPLAGLDGLHREKILAMIHGRRARGTTVIISTHSLETAAACDFAGVMADGKLAAFGPPEEIFGPRWDPSWGLILPWTVTAARILADAGIVPRGAAPLNAQELIDYIGSMDCDCKYTGEEKIPAVDTAYRPHSGEKPAVPAEPPRRRRRRKTGLEMFRRGVWGECSDKASPLRSLSGGVKLALLLAGGTAAVIRPGFLDSMMPLHAGRAVWAAALLAVILTAGAAAGKTGPRRLLRGLIPSLPWICLIMLAQLLYTAQDDTSPVIVSIPIWNSLWKISVTQTELVRAVSLALRLASLMALFSLYSAVTPIRETLGTLNRFLAAFLPKAMARDISMAAGIALRFVPVLTEEAERIVTAQLSRGGKKGRIGMALSMIVPLFFRTLERSEKLAQTFILRLYGYRDTSKDADC